MNICKIWDADYPWDIRVEKIVLSLIEAGHKVDLICRNQARQTRVETQGKFTIRRLPILVPSVPPLHTLCNFPFPLNPVWIASIQSAITAARADLILVRDLPLALAAGVLGKIHRIPVVFDMAEHYPAMLEDRLRYTPTGLFGRIARSPGIARLVEQWTLRLVDHTIVVVEESGERLICSGYPKDRITVVGNTPRTDQWEVQDLPGRRKDKHSRLNLVYLGNLDGIRGLDVAIHAMRILKDEGVRAHMTVIGDGPSLNFLRRLAEDCGVTECSDFVGRLSLNDPAAMLRVKQIMADSDVGLIPHYATEACNSTVPNKLFDYMTMGLPVVVSDMKPTERIVREEQCGEVFKDRDSSDLARCVQRLVDVKSRQEKGMRGREAIRRRYHWSYDAKVLVGAIESTVAQYRARQR